MSTIYTKSLATDFGGTWDQSQFHDEIEAEAGITPTLTGVNLTEDVVDIVFESALSVGEQTTLDTLISNHTPTVKQGSIKNTYIPHDNKIKAKTFKKILSFIFQGSNTIELTHIKMISYLDTGTSYDVKIYDSTNNNTIVTINSTNATENIIDMGTISNLPAEQSKFELHVRVSGTKKPTAYVDSIFLFYR
jgi:hypothetical protein